MDRLERVLELWRATRAPELAHLVEVFGRLDATDPGAGDGGPDNHDTWMRAAASATTNAWTPLLDVLDGTPYADQALERLITAMANGPDPRITAALERLILGLRYRHEPDFWYVALETFSAWAPVDTALHALADAILAKDQSHYAIGFADQVRTLSLAGPEPSPIPVVHQTELRAWLTAHPPPFRLSPGRDPSVDELLEQVAAQLDDEAPREVLADLWTERGDPRGRFVRLQLERARRERAHPRLMAEPHAEEDALLDEYEGLWFGPWMAAVRYRAAGVRVVNHCVRGFPAYLQIHHRLKHLDNLRGSPSLQTVQVVQLRDVFDRRSRRQALLALMTDPSLRNVRQLLDVPADPTLTVELLGTCPHITYVDLSGEMGQRRSWDAVEAVVRDAPHRHYRLQLLSEPDLEVQRIGPRGLTLAGGYSLSFEGLLGMLDVLHADVREVVLSRRTRESVGLQRAGGWWEIQFGPRVTPLAWISALLASGMVRLPQEVPVHTDTVFTVEHAEELALLEPLPSGVVQLAEGLSAAEVPARFEVWGDVASLWLDAPHLPVFGARSGRPRTHHRVHRRPDGRLDVHAVGYGLAQLEPMLGSIARVLGPEEVVADWCAAQGIQHGRLPTPSHAT